MVRLPRDVQEAVIAHSVAALPEEACGLPAVAAGGEVRVAYCLGNVERSSTRFTVDPDGHFAALCHAEGNGWQIGGAFHSHPRSAAAPSRTDVAGALAPDWGFLIVGPGGGASWARGWRVRGG